MDNVDQVFLVDHHFFYRLVGRGNFVDHTFVLAAQHARRLRLDVLLRKGLGRRCPAHAPAGAVGTRLETLLHALAAQHRFQSIHAEGLVASP